MTDLLGDIDAYHLPSYIFYHTSADTLLRLRVDGWDGRREMRAIMDEYDQCIESIMGAIYHTLLRRERALSLVSLNSTHAHCKYKEMEEHIVPTSQADELEMGRLNVGHDSDNYQKSNHNSNGGSIHGEAYLSWQSQWETQRQRQHAHILEKEGKVIPLKGSGFTWTAVVESGGLRLALTSMAMVVLSALPLRALMFATAGVGNSFGDYRVDAVYTMQGPPLPVRVM